MDIKKTYKHLATCLLLGAALVTGAAGCGPKAGPGRRPGATGAGRAAAAAGKGGGRRPKVRCPARVFQD